MKTNCRREFDYEKDNALYGTCLLTCPGWASYTYVIDTYQLLPDLFGTESMLITNNGGGGLHIFN